MLFQTLDFLIFFVVLLFTLNFVRKNRLRKIVFLIFSCVFYMWWNPIFIFLIIFTISFDYLISLKIFNSTSQSKKKNYLIISVVVNLSVLFFFKYYNFFQENINQLMHFLGGDLRTLPILSIVLPVGISFYTFESISYNVDVYRGELKPPKKLLDFISFIVFFPKLVAGPIVRPHDFLPQLDSVKKVDFKWEFIFLILFGLSKKIIIADNLGFFADKIFEAPESYTSIMIWLAALAFTFQIYCDFSGYTDIAIGLAAVLGYKFNINFNKPYFAVTPSDFWNRWHISLSSWLRDYLYIPLGGNRNGRLKMYRNLFLTMVIGGFWHGASWNFILWGALHGISQILYKYFGITKKKIYTYKKYKVFLYWLVFQIFIVITWITFRITNFNHLKSALHKSLLFDGNFNLLSSGLGTLNLPMVLGLMLTFATVHTVSFFKGGLVTWASNQKLYSKLIIIAIFTIALYVFWPTSDAPFIYFQF